MADKPSRSLVVFGDGFAPLINPSHLHLHSLAALSSCGFLALRSAPLPAENCDDREIREFAQLVDAYDYYVSLSNNGDASRQEMWKKGFPTISERFMGLRAALISSGPSVCSFARELGMAVFEIEDLVKQNYDSNFQRKKFDGGGAFLISQLLSLLGFQGGEVVDKNEYDLVFFHIKAGENIEILKDKLTIRTDAGWINILAGEILQIVEPGSKIASRLHLSFILTHGRVDENDCTSASVAMDTMNSDLSLLRPRQSYTMKGGKVLDGIRHHHPFLLSQWQEAVTRRDMAKEFYFKEFDEKGGNLTILADRFLHELAFKLWKAPKYGA